MKTLTQNKREQQKQERERYNPPTLVEYGAVLDLTKGKS